VALSSDALLTVAELADYLGKDETTLTPVGRYESWINMASTEILRICDRDGFITTSGATEQFDGHDQKTFYPRGYPLTAVSKVEYYNSATAWTEATSTTWYRDTDSAKMWFTDGAVFSRNARWRVTYNYGWAVGSVPDDLKECCADLVRLKQLKGEKGLLFVRSESHSDQSTSYDLDKAMADIKRRLTPYIRLSIG